jgi:hypothetical protein
VPATGLTTRPGTTAAKLSHPASASEWKHCEVYLRDQGTYSDVPLHYTSEYGKLHPDEKLL